MNTKFILRGLLVALPATLIFAVIGLNLINARTPLGRPPNPTPLPPIIRAPRGEMPSGPVGLVEWVQLYGPSSVHRRCI